MVRLYLDEDVNVLLASLLHSRNIFVTTTREQRNLGKSDSAQFNFAIQNSLSIVTHNRVDFENLYQEYIEAGKKTSGIIILIRRDVYTMSRLLSRFVLTHENISNQLWYV